DEFDGFAAWAFDHDGAGLSEPIGPFKKRDALAAQFADPSIEVGDAQSDMVLHLASARGERLVGVVRVPGQHDIAEFDAGARATEHAFAVERGPGAVGAARDAAIAFVEVRVGKTLTHRRVQVLLVPEQGAERLLVPHMHVVEALLRLIARGPGRRILAPARHPRKPALL